MYAITGATGHTGEVAAKNLLSHGQPVRAIGRSLERLEALAAEGAEPFVCDLLDTDGLVKAFTGARAVYLMIPPNMMVDDYRAFQDLTAASLATAVEKAGVRYAVTLSSVGADKTGGTGPVLGLHKLEQRLNQLSVLNVLHLRAGYFMENTLDQIGIIKATGAAAGPLSPDLKLPMIASRDIGVAVAERLLSLDFSLRERHELLGERDIDMTEAAGVIGSAIGKPGLAYNRLSDEQTRNALIGLGMSPGNADLLLELSAALNSGHVAPLEQRSLQNTTPTSYETFVAEELAPGFRG